MKDTQKQSYEAILKDMPRSRQEVYVAIKQAGVVTGFQLASFLQKPLHAVSGRLTELEDARLIRDTGLRLKNPASGRKSIMWEVTA